MGSRCVFPQACLDFGSAARTTIKIMPVTVETKEKHSDAVGFSG
jgi:hypothetical protein